MQIMLVALFIVLVVVGLTTAVSPASRRRVNAARALGITTAVLVVIVVGLYGLVSWEYARMNADTEVGDAAPVEAHRSALRSPASGSE